MDYMFSQHDLSFLDDVIPEKDKKKKEDEKKKRSSIGSDAEDVRLSSLIQPSRLCSSHQSPPPPHPPPPSPAVSTLGSVCRSMIHLSSLSVSRHYFVELFYPSILALRTREILPPIPFVSTSVSGERSPCCSSFNNIFCKGQTFQVLRSSRQAKRANTDAEHEQQQVQSEGVCLLSPTV